MPSPDRDRRELARGAGGVRAGIRVGPGGGVARRGTAELATARAAPTSCNGLRGAELPAGSRSGSARPCRQQAPHRPSPSCASGRQAGSTGKTALHWLLAGGLAVRRLPWLLPLPRAAASSCCSPLVLLHFPASPRMPPSTPQTPGQSRGQSGALATTGGRGGVYTHLPRCAAVPPCRRAAVQSAAVKPDTSTCPDGRGRMPDTPWHTQAASP